MVTDDIKILSEAERQQQQERKRQEKLAKQKEFDEATSSKTFETFNRFMGVLSALFTLVFCVAALWSTSKWLVVVMAMMAVLSFVCKYLAKYFFFKGDRRKFEMFNKLSGVAGVVTSLFELLDLRDYRSKGALDKADRLESTIQKAVSSVAENQYNGGIYTDAKYDSIRDRAYKTGKYIFGNTNIDHIKNIVERVTTKRKGLMMTDRASVVIGVLSMYINDYIDGSYEEGDRELLFSCIGALHYYLQPLTEIPDYLPLVGYQDEMFVSFCVYAGHKEDLDKYKEWKINYTKRKLKYVAMRGQATIWSKLQEQGCNRIHAGNVAQLCKECKDKLSDATFIAEENRDNLLILIELALDYTNGVYCTIDTSIINGILGALSYWVRQADCIPDDVTVLGYVDDEVILECCVKECLDTIKYYKTWKTLHKLKEENDPLVDYLNAVIGDDESLRKEEVTRLSKLYPREDLADDCERARYVLAEII